MISNAPRPSGSWQATGCSGPGECWADPATDAACWYYDQSNGEWLLTRDGEIEGWYPSIPGCTAHQAALAAGGEE